MKQHDKGNGNASKPEKPAVGASRPVNKLTLPAKESGKPVTIWAFFFFSFLQCSEISVLLVVINYKYGMGCNVGAHLVL